MAEPTRVLIADDHTLVREGVRLLIDAQAGFRVVGEASNGLSALRLVAQTEPDIVLLDLFMPEMSGLEAVQEIARCHPQVRTLILTMHDDERLFMQAMRSGAAGYLLKGASSAELIEALKVVARGDVYLPPAFVAILVRDFRQGWRPLDCDDRSPAELLSTRELEVLRHLAEGKTNAQIAGLLVLSVSTVQTHRSRIFEKLGLHTRADLVKYALRHGVTNLL